MTKQVSDHECRAIRNLDEDPDYTRSEIAFMFETNVDTVARHADRDCHHQVLGDGAATGNRAWTDGELETAYRLVYDRQPYQKMSKQIYDDHKPEKFPSGDTISKHLGGWMEAREQALNP